MAAAGFGPYRRAYGADLVLALVSVIATSALALPIGVYSPSRIAASWQVSHAFRLRHHADSIWNANPSFYMPEALEGIASMPAAIAALIEQRAT